MYVLQFLNKMTTDIVIYLIERNVKKNLSDRKIKQLTTNIVSAIIFVIVVKEV